MLCECGCSRELIGRQKRFASGCREKYWSNARKIGAGKIQAVLSQAVNGPVVQVPLFDGRTYNHRSDGARLTRQYKRVFDLMADSQWRTLDEIARATGDQHQSISARLRDFRKSRFGNHTVERRPRGDRERGLFEYRLIVNQAA